MLVRCAINSFFSIRAWAGSVRTTRLNVTSTGTRAMCTTPPVEIERSEVGELSIETNESNQNEAVSPEVKKVTNLRIAVQNAREAITVANHECSDDDERDRALSLGRFAIRSYNNLLEEASNESGAIAKLLESDVEAMKAELYKSRWQRMWIGWRGWF